MEIKKIYRCREHHVLSGVCAGVGEYFAIDPVIVRLAFIFAVLVTGVVPGVFVYIVAAILIPIKPHV